MYLEYYGLEHRPFDMTPDPDFLFFTERHREAFAHLVYGIREGQGFIEISGEVGTGKTTLCRAILGEIDDDKVRLAMILSPTISDIELLQSICDELLIERKGETKKELLDSIYAYLIQEHKRNRRVVLLIDEAQNLPGETLEQLRMLSNLETEKEKLVQIILVGQPELREKLSRRELRQLNQRISVRYHLTPMNRKETEDYIAYRLAVGGSEGRIRFTRDALDLIYKFSGGVPRKVNVACDRALLLGYVRGTLVFDREIIESAIHEVLGKPEKPRRRRMARVAMWGMGLGLTTAVSFAAAAFFLGFLGEVDLLGLNRSSGVRVASLEPGFPAGSDPRLPTAPEETHPTRNADTLPAQANGAEPRSQGNDTPHSTGVPGKESDLSTQAAGSTPVESRSSPQPNAQRPPEEATRKLKPTEIIQRANIHGEFDEAGLLRVNKPWASRAAAILSLAHWLGAEQSGLLRDFNMLETGSGTMDEALKQAGFRMGEISVSPKFLEQIDLPVALEIDPLNSDPTRYLILRQMENLWVKLDDPMKGQEIWAKDRLWRQWFGRAIICLPQEAFYPASFREGARGAVVRRMEERLASLNLFPETPDSQFGAETTAALRLFQRKNSLPDTGIATIETQVLIYSKTAGEELPRLCKIQEVSDELHP